MITKIKQLPLLLSLFALLFFMSGSFLKNAAASIEPDYTGKWVFSFYDGAGNMLGKKTIFISQDGLISEDVNLIINNVLYNTEVSGTITADGKVADGDLRNKDKIEMTGTLTGKFTEEEGSGTWKNYYNKSGTWKATRPAKDKKG